MSKRILINASQAGEVWATYVENGTLEELFVESSRKQILRGNIYRAHVTSVDHKLQAAFIDYGTDRNGFISIRDIHPDCYHRASNEKLPNIRDVLQVGHPLLVQIKKEESRSKGAALTTDLTLASAYTVIAPVRGGEFSISRKITDAKVKRSLREMMKKADPDNRHGVTLRTASEGRKTEEVLADLQNQIRAWGHIQADFQMKTEPGILYKESQLMTRMIRDHFTNEVDEIVVDDETSYNDLKRYCEERLPVAAERLKFYEERLPLFVRYRIEEQINHLTAHQIDLPSGGNISINHTEALTVFDINSSRQSGGGDQLQMFLRTNCEAAELIARQVRLRGIGGLIVIDFINMRDMKQRRQVEKVFKEAIKRDRAHLEVGVLSRFCILELSRNRIQERSLSTTHTTCPTCDGSGYIPSANIVAFKLINLLYGYAEKVGPGKVIHGKLPVAHAMYLLNEKRRVLIDLEERYGVIVEIEPDFTQSLLAPDPFTEGGRSIGESAARPERERRERRDRKDKRERKDRKDRPQSPHSKGRRRPDPSRTKTADLPATIDVSDEEVTPFIAPQIIGFIPKEQLDRAEAASLVSQATATSLSTSEEPVESVGTVESAQSMPSKSTRREEPTEEGKKRRKRRRRGRGEGDTSARIEPTHESKREADESSTTTEPLKPSTEQESASIERPALDDKARRRSEARARNRAKKLKRLQGERQHRDQEVSSGASSEVSREGAEVKVRSNEPSSERTDVSETPSTEKRAKRRRVPKIKPVKITPLSSEESLENTESEPTASKRRAPIKKRASTKKNPSLSQDKGPDRDVGFSEIDDEDGQRAREIEEIKPPKKTRRRSKAPVISSVEGSVSSEPSEEKITPPSPSTVDSIAEGAPPKKMTPKKVTPKTEDSGDEEGLSKKAPAKKNPAKKAPAKKVTKAPAKKAPAKKGTPKNESGEPASSDLLPKDERSPKKKSVKKTSQAPSAQVRDDRVVEDKKESTSSEETTGGASAKKVPAKKAPAKKAPAKKTPAKKAPAKKAPAVNEETPVKKRAPRASKSKSSDVKDKKSLSAKRDAAASELLSKLTEDG